MRNIFFPKMKKGTFYSPTSGGRSLEEYLPLCQMAEDLIWTVANPHLRIPKLSVCQMAEDLI